MMHAVMQVLKITDSDRLQAQCACPRWHCASTWRLHTCLACMTQLQSNKLPLYFQDGRSFSQVNTCTDSTDKYGCCVCDRWQLIIVKHARQPPTLVLNINISANGHYLAHTLHNTPFHPTDLPFASGHTQSQSKHSNTTHAWALA